MGSDALLIWCNANGRERIARFIDEAKHTLFAQNERYQDSVIIEVVERLRDIAHHDWKHSHPFDLTDEGLLEELKEHKIDAAEALALGDGRGKERKKKR